MSPAPDTVASTSKPALRSRFGMPQDVWWGFTTSLVVFVLAPFTVTLFTWLAFWIIPPLGMTEDASWGKMQPTWGSPEEVAELNRLFDQMQEFCTRNDLPAFIGEFGVTDKKEQASRVRWMTAVAEAALSRRMVPVLWDTGGDIARKPPHDASPALQEVLRNIGGPG